MKIETFKELIVWQKSLALRVKIYKATVTFPSEEKFGLTSQLRRCSVSIPSNIAEGWGRGTTNNYINFLRIARGSLCELETQLIISKELEFLGKDRLDDFTLEIVEISKMINSIIVKLDK